MLLNTIVFPFCVSFSTFKQQKFHRIKNNNFYINGCSKPQNRTIQINNYLFGGKKTLEEGGPYNYCIDFHASGFVANALPSDSKSGLSKFCLNNNNEMKEKGQC